MEGDIIAKNSNSNIARYNIPGCIDHEPTVIGANRKRFATNYGLPTEVDFYYIAQVILELCVYYVVELHDINSVQEERNLNTESLDCLIKHFLSKHSGLYPKSIEDLQSKVKGQIMVLETDLDRIAALTGVKASLGRIPRDSRILKIAPKFCEKYSGEIK